MSKIFIVKLRFVIILLIYLVLATTLVAQNGNNPGTTRPLTKWEKMFPQVKYNDKIYETGSNWFNVAYGAGWHTNRNVFNQNFSMAYHHRYHAMYFNFGWHYSAPQIISPKLAVTRPMEKLNDIHAGAGLRFEERYYNFAFFIGPSFATTWIPVNESVSQVNYQLGAHTEVQFTFKYFYDLGIGTSLYGSFNKRYQVVGIQLHLYFSNAFVMEY